MQQDQIEKHSTTRIGHFAFTTRDPGRGFLLPRTSASCQNGVSLNFCSLSRIRLCSCSCRTRIPVISGEEKDRPLYVTGHHQLSKPDPVVAILRMGKHYFFDCRRYHDTF